MIVKWDTILSGPVTSPNTPNLAWCIYNCLLRWAMHTHHSQVDRKSQRQTSIPSSVHSSLSLAGAIVLDLPWK
jgi:hypothetical protein